MEKPTSHSVCDSRNDGKTFGQRERKSEMNTSLTPRISAEAAAAAAVHLSVLVNEDVYVCIIHAHVFGYSAVKKYLPSS